MEPRGVPIRWAASAEGAFEVAMISLKRYLEGEAPVVEEPEASVDGLLEAMLRAYGAAMGAMGNCSLDACPGIGDGLKQRMGGLSAELSAAMGMAALQATDRGVQDGLQEWGRDAARHFRDKAAEVKELLLTMARTGEAVGARDQRCAGQMHEVTARLRKIATLEDLSQIRASIEASAAELRGSIERMTAEGKAAVDDLRKQVATYQARLEEAEELASRDALTGVRNRLCLEPLIESRIALGAAFCVAMIDLDGFKNVNDTHGHLAGDELLKQFAAELRSACRATDVIGRWGGDEFLIVLDCERSEAETRVERLQKWVCGDYTVRGREGTLKLRLDASIGLADHRLGEAQKALLARADAAMYKRKAASRAS